MLVFMHFFVVEFCSLLFRNRAIYCLGILLFYVLIFHCSRVRNELLLEAASEPSQSLYPLGSVIPIQSILSIGPTQSLSRCSASGDFLFVYIFPRSVHYLQTLQSGILRVIIYLCTSFVLIFPCFCRAI